MSNLTATATPLPVAFNILIALVLSLPQLLRGETFSYIVDPHAYQTLEEYKERGLNNSFENRPGSTGAGRAQLLEFIHNTETNRLRVVAEIHRSSGKLPNSFEIILNDSAQHPIRMPDRGLATIYYDFTDFNNPVLTSFVYRGNVESYAECSIALDGFQPPDKIVSSLADDSFIRDLIAEQLSPNLIRVGFDIDATVINSHQPTCPDQLDKTWEGVRFSELIGVWFHVIKNSEDILYTTDGYPTNIVLSKELDNFTAYDISFEAELHTDLEDPVCNQLAAPPIVSELPYTASFVGHDPQDDPLAISYNGLPAGVQVKPPAGSVVSSPASVELSWTPTTQDAGQDYEVEIVLTDSKGAEKICPLMFTVPNVECRSFDAQDSIGYLDGGSLKLRKLVRAAARRIKRIHGELTLREEKLLAEANALHLQAWRAINQLPASVMSCSINPLCVEIQHTADLDAYRSASEKLVVILRSLTRKLRKAIRADLISSSDLKERRLRAARRIERRAIATDRSNRANLDLLPISSSICIQERSAGG